MGVAKGLNTFRGGGPPWAGLSASGLQALSEAALLRYLAVAHFGRGRGDWHRDAVPQHWVPVAQSALEKRQNALDALWAGRSRQWDAPDDPRALAAALVPLLRGAMRDALLALYPEAAAQWTS